MLLHLSQVLGVSQDTLISGNDSTPTTAGKMTFSLSLCLSASVSAFVATSANLHAISRRLNFFAPSLMRASTNICIAACWKMHAFAEAIFTSSNFDGFGASFSSFRESSTAFRSAMKCSDNSISYSMPKSVTREYKTVNKNVPRLQ